MDNWANNDIEAMLSYVMPSWRSTKTDPATSLFIIIANRTPLDYTIESVSGSSGDTSRSITMTASIDKNNGNDPVRYRFIILVDKEDGNWYVDPNSLSTNDVDTTEPTIVPDDVAAVYTRQPRMTVTPVPPPSTLAVLQSKRRQILPCRSRVQLGERKIPADGVFHLWGA